MVRIKTGLPGVIWIIITGVTAHLLFSSLGFNPTDDGVTLAYARRIMEGQVPHRDFITIRPFLSPLLHIPEIILGGGITIWLSRFIVFMQFAVISWLGTKMITGNLKKSLNLAEQYSIAWMVFIFCCHSFPIMAWSTIDGIFFSIIGFSMITNSRSTVKLLGYFLIGLAPLCKQGFLFLPPLALLVYSDWRNLKNILFAFLPSIIYILFLVLSRAMSEAFNQLYSGEGFMESALISFWRFDVFKGIVLGLISVSLIKDNMDSKHRLRKLAGIMLGMVALLLFFRYLIIEFYNNSMYDASFILFGLSLGMLLHEIIFAPGEWKKYITGILVIGLVWMVSISVGYNSPALGAGLLICHVIAMVLGKIPQEGSVYWRTTVLFTLAVVSAFAFYHIRTWHIYRERPAEELTAELGDVLPGGNKIRTNPNTHLFLGDLKKAVQKTDSIEGTYTIIPSVAAWWIKSETENPLPIDWVQGGELKSEYLRRRVSDSILHSRSGQAVIVQKVKASRLPDKFATLDKNQPYNAIVDTVDRHLGIIAETRFFTIYK